MTEARVAQPGLQGRSVLVSAAGQGIGRAIATACIDAGATVIASDLRASLLAGLECRHEELDVTDREQIEALIGGAGRLDTVVNCAGLVRQGALLETTDEDWSVSFDVNVRSGFWMMRAAIASMLRSGGGSIINIASVVSSLRAAPRRFAYAASKAAIIGMTKSAALDYAAAGVRVNAICPGTVDSPSLRERVAGSVDPAKARAAMVARQPLGRLGLPAEIAQLAVYLASDAGSFATGSVFVVDGGMSL